METKTYTSSGFSHKCSTEELFVLTLHWLTDITFFELEIEFLQSLINVFFIPASDSLQVKQGYNLEEQLAELKNRKEILKNNIIAHQNELSAILDKNLADKKDEFNSIQSVVEGDFFDFIKTFRKIKLQLFTLSKQFKQPAIMQKA
ncbi:MAG: hypothetical protein H7Y13_01740 [Sphingobacteriaceae bacterium]|nr:hypothetical protein [Sphingobacteriaceae bacterium]